MPSKVALSFPVQTSGLDSSLSSTADSAAVIEDGQSFGLQSSKAPTPEFSYCAAQFMERG